MSSPAPLSLDRRRKLDAVEARASYVNKDNSKFASSERRLGALGDQVFIKEENAQGAMIESYKDIDDDMIRASFDGARQKYLFEGGM